MTDAGPENTGAEDANAEDLSPPQRFDKRIEKWILGLRDQADEHTPEVLDGLAATAKSVATYLDDMAAQVRQKRATTQGVQGPGEQPADTPDETDEPSDT